MKIAVMQPYLLAYIGYYQLINAVDRYIILDDVQYIKGGWINRNRFLRGTAPAYFTLSVKKAGHALKINQRVFCEKNHAKDKDKLLKSMDFYRKAPFYKEGLEVVRRVTRCEDLNVSRFVINSIREVCRYLEITTPLEILSGMDYDRSLEKQERIIDLCRRLRAAEYINPAGGTGLYSREKFTQQGVRLSFLKTGDIIYPQFRHAFVPNLSIIDLIMFNPKEKIREFLTRYDLV